MLGLVNVDGSMLAVNSIGKHGMKWSEVNWKKGKLENLPKNRNNWKSFITNRPTHESMEKRC